MTFKFITSNQFKKLPWDYTKGLHLLEKIENVTEQDMLLMFPAASAPCIDGGYKGYGDYEWYFTNDLKEHFVVYFRHFKARIGGEDDASQFKSWLLEKLDKPDPRYLVDESEIKRIMQKPQLEKK